PLHSSPFSFYGSVPHLALHSFPTRRSSDLGRGPAWRPGRMGNPATRKCRRERRRWRGPHRLEAIASKAPAGPSNSDGHTPALPPDRKSTRLNSSHRTISYAVFCLKKKKKKK